MLQKLDKLVALLLVAFFVAYIYLSFNFQLLPFEQRMSFRPDTMPKGVGVIGVICAFAVLFSGDASLQKDDSEIKAFDYKSFVLIVVGMFIYASLIKPLGFIIATTIFLAASGYILGERKYVLLLVIALIGSSSIWFIIDRLLGIYLSPIPAFM